MQVGGQIRPEPGRQYADRPAAPVGDLETAVRETERQQSVARTTAAFLGVPPDKVCTLLQNVWRVTKGQPPLSPQEMFCGMSLIARYGLDPIAREVYVTRDKTGRLITIVGIDGWIKILDRTDHYDGFEQEIATDDSGKVVWVETKIHSTRRSHPAVYRAYMDEYVKLGGYVAAQIPSHMLRIFSLRHAARMFTPLGGAVTEEEARWMGADYFGAAKAPEHHEPDPTTTEPADAPDQRVTDKLRRRARKKAEPAPAPDRADEPEPEPMDARSAGELFPDESYEPPVQAAGDPNPF